ncbi:hypothetical protein SAMN05421749_101660 [Acinetobacter marinus]|uniref:Uncharacterized protein n=2 Tax=Acinetobacter marinus TaxID=281375 RepID=A0A1G6H1U2_9GAMM|nr:hypothetical protein SAMN05421749_101660 [Acinetobacter marinus]
MIMDKRLNFKLKKNRLTQAISWAMLSAGLAICTQSYAANQTIISNMAIGEYTEEGSTVVQTSRSNLVQTTILPVYSMQLTANNTKNVATAQTVYLPHTLTNNGNFADQYTLTSANVSGDGYDLTGLVIYLDANRDGLPDSTTPITAYALEAGQSVGLILSGTVPSTATAGQVARLTLSANASNGGNSISNTDALTVTNQSALEFRKKFSVIETTTNGIVTIRIDYRNYGAVATGAVVLTDILSTDLDYLAGSENWNGTAVNPATGANDPTGIDYSVTADVLTATISSIPADSSGYIEFRATVVRSTAGNIENVINISADHDNSGTTANISDQSNTASVRVNPIYGVEINASSSTASHSSADNILTAAGVSQGGVINFNNYVWNTGNTTDRYNLTIANNTFPVGSVVEFYRADGVTPLLDSNGDGIPDTGSIAPNQHLAIVVKVRLPSDYAVSASETYSISPQAQSINQSAVVDTVEDRSNLNAITSTQLVDLYNSPETTNNGTGNGSVSNAGNAWKTLTTTSSSTDAGASVVFPLTVKHTGTPTEYLLSADADQNFAQANLPAGVNAVRFYQSADASCTTLGAEIGKTRYLNDGESQTVCAVVEIDATAASGTVPIYFRASSTSTASSDGTSNVGFDSIHNAITIQNVESVAQIEFMPDLSGQVAPLGTIVYSHLLINHADSALDSTHNFTISNSNSAFKADLYLDSNGNGQFDSADTVIDSIADLPGGVLAANSEVRLFVRVENTATNNLAQTNTTTVNLVDASDVVIDQVVDLTTVNNQQLILTKLQGLDADCNGAVDDEYTSNTLPIGKSADGSGQCVQYRVTLTNQSATALNSAFNFRDQTPAYTVLSHAVTCASCTGVTAPAIGQSGNVTGSLANVASGQSYEFSFGVRYVGQ